VPKDSGKKAAPAPPKKSKKGSSEESSSDASAEAPPKKAEAPQSDKKRKAEAAPAEETPKKKAKTDGDSAAPKSPADGDGSGNNRVFVGNLPYTIDDEQIRAFFADVGELTDIHWVTDKQTGKFYGSGFLEFSTSAQAQAALGKAGADVGGRNIKIDLAQPRGERKPSGFAAGGAGGARGEKPKRDSRGPTPKPDGCTTVFLGNLPFSIDEDTLRGVFSDCGEITSIRWVEKDGQFKGCGFIDFSESGATDAAVAKNGQDVQGRQIRVDYSAPRPPRQ